MYSDLYINASSLPAANLCVVLGGFPDKAAVKGFFISSCRRWGDTLSLSPRGFAVAEALAAKPRFVKKLLLFNRKRDFFWAESSSDWVS